MSGQGPVIGPGHYSAIPYGGTLPSDLMQPPGLYMSALEQSYALRGLR
ncbi:MAG: hypothetical protein HYS81_04550 [Candidatus Aenigmatarchaeota archaeon]|nr:MAG: hypothetical protein HYS81_04550 [Candidatus Aenigmarchaeota archaeon]